MLNARNVPLAELEARAAEIDKHKAKPVIVVCDNGNRSGRAATALPERLPLSHTTITGFALCLSISAARASSSARGTLRAFSMRSEERRVGKKGRSRWWPNH